MPKVKLVLVSNDGGGYNDYDDYYGTAVIRTNITDWDEISDEEYDFLLKNKGYNLNQAMKIREGSSVMILKQDDEPVLNRIDSITKLIKKMEDDRIKEEQARIAKKEATALKKRLNKEAKTKDEELALLAALKEKHEKA